MEALVLGLSSGLFCVAACGAVLLPYLASNGAAWRANAGQLTAFLGGRLLGYLGFAVLAWALGAAISAGSRTSGTLFAVAHLGLAAILIAWAVRRRGCEPNCAAGNRNHSPRLVSLGLPRHLPWLTAVGLGLFTGVSPCPPFLAAGVRAAERHSLAGALLFFALFFVGTSIWFVPFAVVPGFRRMGGLQTVARFTTVIVAVCYGYLGVVSLAGVILHG